MKNGKKAVYVAGPYTGNTLATARNIRRGINLAIDIMEMGYTVYAPWCDYMFALQREIPVQAYFENGLRIMERFDCLMLAPNWEFSPGTMGEIQRARKLDMPIYLTKRDLLNDRQTSLGYDADGNLRKLLIVCGPPASGKTTWCQHAQEHQKLTTALAAYYSMDDMFLEYMCDDGAVRKYWSDSDGKQHSWATEPIPDEQIITAYTAMSVKVFEDMAAGKPLIITEGAFELSELRQTMVRLAVSHNYYVEVKIPSTGFAATSLRNTLHANQVPESVSMGIIERWQPPSFKEGFDSITEFFTEGMEATA